MINNFNENGSEKLKKVKKISFLPIFLWAMLSFQTQVSSALDNNYGDDFYSKQNQTLNEGKDYETIIKELELENLRLENEILREKLQQNNNEYTVNHRILKEELPENISINIKGWTIYYNWDGAHDYYASFKRSRLSDNLKNWLSPGEEWTITLETWKVDMWKINSYPKRTINISYQWDSIKFEHNNSTIYKLITKKNKRKPIKVLFWDNIRKKNRGKEHWKFLEFYIKLNWR